MIISVFLSSGRMMPTLIIGSFAILLTTDFTDYTDKLTAKRTEKKDYSKFNTQNLKFLYASIPAPNAGASGNWEVIKIVSSNLSDFR